ncbi:hypothetical protein MJO29_002617 [Puccinia striiformis f. sp. tritici]|nr:hypothetical protein MJO29_002617 [Puccinia striiformis f. sp. tritici]
MDDQVTSSSRLSSCLRCGHIQLTAPASVEGLKVGFSFLVPALELKYLHSSDFTVCSLFYRDLTMSFAYARVCQRYCYRPHSRFAVLSLACTRSSSSVTLRSLSEIINGIFIQINQRKPSVQSP